VLERGEKIELLVDKTDRLNQQAFKFEKQSKKLKNAMWWKNMQMMIVMGLVALIAIYIVVGMVCGFDLKKCIAKKN
jgi:vesicle-associated membrane protein 7